MYKDINIKYQSPTIGLQFTQRGFVEFCKRFDHYINLSIDIHPSPSLEEFKELGGVGFDFPVGRLGDLTVFLQHYSSIREADLAWKRRSSRINKSSLFFIFLAFDETDDTTIEDFYAVSTGNKLVLTNSDRREVFPDSYPLLNHKSAWFDIAPGERDPYYWRFDFIDWMAKILD